MSEQQQNIPLQEIPVEKSGDQSTVAEERSFCALYEQPARVFEPGVTSEREALINMMGNKWVNGTVLRYYFFDREKTDGQNVLFSDGRTEWRTWAGDNKQQDVVRQGLTEWQKVGIGISFEEVKNREEAEIRIGFMRGDGSWSWLGRDILEQI